MSGEIARVGFTTGEAMRLWLRVLGVTKSMIEGMASMVDTCAVIFRYIRSSLSRLSSTMRIAHRVDGYY